MLELMKMDGRIAVVTGAGQGMGKEIAKALASLGATVVVAELSPKTGEATARDLEELGELVRADVKAKTGVQLDWEIKRIGRPG